MKYPRLRKALWNVAVGVTAGTLYVLSYYNGVARGKVEANFERAVTTCKAEIDSLLAKYPEYMKEEDKR